MILMQNGRRQFCDVLGREDAPVVCFLHSLCADSDMWSDQVPALLAQDYRVVRLDMRGHGASELDSDYSFDGLANDVLAALDALAIQTAHVVGLSIGGMIAQLLAIKHPTRLVTAILCDTMPCGPDAKDRCAFVDRLDAVRRAGELTPVVEHGLRVRFTDRFETQRPERYVQMRRNYLSSHAAAYIGCMQVIANFDFREELKKVELPVLVVSGSDDPSTPPAVGRELANIVKNGEFVEVPDARHLPNVEHPEFFNRILVDWLNRHRTRPGDALSSA